MFWVFWKHYMEENTDAVEPPPVASKPAAAPRAPRKPAPKYAASPEITAIPKRTSRTPRAAKALPTPPAVAVAPLTKPVPVEPTPIEAAAAISLFGRDVYCVLDASLTCYYLMENWQSLSGFPAGEDTGKEFKARLAPDHLRKVARYLEEESITAAPVRFQIRHKDKALRWCDLQLVQAAGSGAKARYKCLISDVTELAVAQSKLAKATLEADLALKSRSEFLANMSHELRTPLNAILGFAQMIESGTYGPVGHPKYHEYIGSIADSGETLLSKINDLLEIANIDSGNMMLNEEPTDLLEVIRHAIEFHSHRAFSEQITLRGILPDRPVVAVVDRIRTLQVITNLISNAIKYNKAGGAVEVSCELRKDGGINIFVEDDGGGIAPSHLQNILSAFRQDNSFFARSRDCVGLGLALSKEIVKLHQGRITIESEPGKGTLLAIRLPKERTVQVEEVEKPAEQETQKQVQEHETPSFLREEYPEPAIAEAHCQEQPAEPPYEVAAEAPQTEHYYDMRRPTRAQYYPEPNYGEQPYAQPQAAAPHEQPARQPEYSLERHYRYVEYAPAGPETSVESSGESMGPFLPPENVALSGQHEQPARHAHFEQRQSDERPEEEEPSGLPLEATVW